MAETLYVVKVWVDPSRGQAYIDWLKGGHVAEVAAVPGAIWARLVELDERADDGWLGFMALYAFESKHALEAYQKSDLFRSFAPIYKKFEGLFRVERATGDVVEYHGR